jgi:hypothetical protein
MDLKPLKLDLNLYPKMTPTLNHVALEGKKVHTSGPNMGGDYQPYSNC